MNRLRYEAHQRGVTPSEFLEEILHGYFASTEVLDGYPLNYS
ncbi:MAG: hypothetical protein ACK5AZ_11760 [Bryobacteraceae bacterium]